MGWAQDDLLWPIMEDTAKTIAQYPPESLVAVFDDQPYLYWRMCSLADSRSEPPPLGESSPFLTQPYSSGVIDVVKQAASQPPMVENVRIPTRSVQVRNDWSSSFFFTLPLPPPPLP